VNLDPHEQLRAEHDAAMQDYLARGGRIDVLPRGAMATAGWKPEDYALQSPKAKARTMRAREIAKEEQAARRRAKAAEPLPRTVKERPAPKPAAPKPAKATRKARPQPDPRIGTRTAEMRRAAMGKPRGKVPHKANAILALLQAKGPMRAREIAEALGDSTQTIGQRLWVMRKRGRITSKGSQGNMRWSAKCP
jgi:hypothetical protein